MKKGKTPFQFTVDAPADVIERTIQDWLSANKFKPMPQGGMQNAAGNYSQDSYGQTSVTASTNAFTEQVNKKNEKLVIVGFILSLIGVVLSFFGIYYGMILVFLDIWMGIQGLSTRKKGLAMY